VGLLFPGEKLDIQFHPVLSSNVGPALSLSGTASWLGAELGIKTMYCGY
jgi:hypothetical protein